MHQERSDIGLHISARPFCAGQLEPQRVAAKATFVTVAKSVRQGVARQTMDEDIAAGTRGDHIVSRACIDDVVAITR